MFDYLGYYYFGYMIGGIVVSIVCGIVAKNINESKGYEGGFAWGFWLGVIGIIVVAVRQENPARHVTEYRPSYLSASAPLSSPANWRCSCGHENYPYMHECSRCGQPKPTSISASSASWKCVCGQTNAHNVTFCTRCRREKPKPQIQTSVATPAPTPTAPTAHASTPAPATPVAPPSDLAPAPAESALDMLERLGKLHESGVLTDAEFAEKKAELLKRL